jgi:ATP adenylyltransferase
VEHLYAPWRMEYIGGTPEPGCLFCRVREADPAEDRTNLVVWRGERALVMLNKFPYNSGHVMVAPRAHVPSLEELDDEDALALHRALSKSLTVLRAELKPEGFNVGANIGKVAGAGVPDHVHVHAVPRWNGDTNFMPVLAETKVVNEHLERTWEKLAAAFSAET